MKKLRLSTPAQKAAVTGILAAAALALSFLESLLPPLSFLPPGAKLGLSNVAVMFAVLCLGLPQALLVVAAKAVFTLFTRGFAAFVMSLCGGVCSCLVMAVLSRPRFRKLGYMGISILSAAAHNMGQLAAASVLTDTALWAYCPALLVFGAVFGALTGTVLRIVMPALEKLHLRSPE